MQTERENDKIFTNILVVQEVSQRLLSELIGNNSITHDVKNSFNVYLKHGEKFRKKWAGILEKIYGPEILELQETDADYNYELFKIISQFRTDRQFEMAKAVLNNILNTKSQ